MEPEQGGVAGVIDISAFILRIAIGGCIRRFQQSREALPV